MKPSYKYTVYQHGYQLHHLQGTIPIIDKSQVDNGNTLKEQSLIEFLSAIVITRVSTDFSELELNEKTKCSLLQNALNEWLRYCEYHIHSVDANNKEEIEVFTCSGEFLKKLEKTIGL